MGCFKAPLRRFRGSSYRAFHWRGLLETSTREIYFRGPLGGVLERSLERFKERSMCLSCGSGFLIPGAALRRRVVNSVLGEKEGWGEWLVAKFSVAARARKAALMAFQLVAGGEPSTWLPPGRPRGSIEEQNYFLMVF